MNHLKIIDISLPMKEGMPVYPGNPEFKLEENKGKTSVHSEISFGTHTGTHLDAPKHGLENETGIDEMPLDSFCGKCRVLNLETVETEIKVSDLEKFNIQKGEKILVRTANSLRGYEKFYDEFAYLGGEAAIYLAEKEISFFGIDYWSIKKRGPVENNPHTVFFEKNIVILEGINLKEVKEGEYYLTAFPLNILNGDGAPTRAVLFDLNS